MKSGTEKIKKELLDTVEKYREAKEKQKNDFYFDLAWVQGRLLFDIALTFVMCIGDCHIYNTELLEYIKIQYLVVDDNPDRIRRLDVITEYEQKYTDLLDDINTNVYNEDELEEKFEILESYESKVRENKDRCFHRFYMDVRHIANLRLESLINYGNTPKHILAVYKHLEAYRYLQYNLFKTHSASVTVQSELQYNEGINDSVKQTIIQSYKNQEDLAYEQLFGEIYEIECDGDVDIFLR